MIRGRTAERRGFDWPAGLDIFRQCQFCSLSLAACQRERYLFQNRSCTDRPMSSISLQANLEPDVMQRLVAEAALQHRTAAKIATAAVAGYLDRKDAERRMIREAQAEAAKGIFISSEAMNAWIESWDSDNELPEPGPDIFPDNTPA